MITFFYNKKILITSLFISIFITLIFSLNFKKYSYTMLLSSKTYTLDNKIYICSDETDIMFASYFALKKYIGSNDDPKNAKIHNYYHMKWLDGKRMNFIFLQKSFSVFPLPNRLIEVKIFDNKKINDEIIKIEIHNILKNLKNGNYFEQHSKNLKMDDMLTVPNYKIFTDDEKKLCEEFYNIVFENKYISKVNIFSIFLILMLGVYFLIFSVYTIKKNKLFN